MRNERDLETTVKAGFGRTLPQPAEAFRHAAWLAYQEAVERHLATRRRPPR